MTKSFFLKKRIFDIFLSGIGIIIITPVLIPFLVLIWLQDFYNPFYISNRVGYKNKQFKIIKLRSMVVLADKSGVDSTSSDDPRITNVGKVVRKFKLDELTQLFNVFLGDMSFVGPRPNVERETRLYTEIENKLLEAKPGITDFSSIIFSDESNILAPFDDPDIAYNQLIRPRKNYLALFYIKNQSIVLDMKLIILTIFAIFNKKKTINYILKIMKNLGASKQLIEMADRKNFLFPMPPPGSSKIVKSRN